MKVVVTGAAGFVGRRLSAALAAAETLHDANDTARPVDRIVAFDAATDAPSFDDHRIVAASGDIADRQSVADLIDDDVGAIFHLASVVSAGAEADFERGYRVNLGGLQNLVAACRRLARPPRLVFTSSIAVYGGIAHVTDATRRSPWTSYGTQKAQAELLLNDATRKGYVDARALRLAAVLVRPGAPNEAVSAFTSTMVREPLAGGRAACPVARDVRLPLISVGRAVAALIDLARMPSAALGRDRAVLMGALSPSAAELAASLARVAGGRVAERIDWRPDPAIADMVAGWPRTVVATRAERLGLTHDRSVDDVIRAFIDQELGGRYAA